MSVSRPIVSIETSPKGVTPQTPSPAIPSSLIPRPIVSFTSATTVPIMKKEVNRGAGGSSGSGESLGKVPSVVESEKATKSK